MLEKASAGQLMLVQRGHRASIAGSVHLCNVICTGVRHY